jgi:hypothetical protein
MIICLLTSFHHNLPHRVGSFVFNFLSLILEISSLIALANAAVAASGITYVIQAVYLIFSLYGLSGVYQNSALLVKMAVVGCYIKGFLSIIAVVIIGTLGNDIDLGGPDSCVYVVAGLISKCG